ncbi:hypothetical protein L596_013011 [Steinernema carpocapsae]|uniref:BTB domain-containing protein n=1 Tax=Steinernema carpocapsae TaxID=34508 RepID=A0A4U5NYT5_STECR|nr:hypothetical protein L596_013011 [Steinernema carpocapsae]
MIKGVLNFAFGFGKVSDDQDIDNFTWVADESVRCGSLNSHDDRCTLMRCHPKEENKRTQLWTCLARGSFISSNEEGEDGEQAIVQLWSASFNNKEPESHVHWNHKRFKMATKPWKASFGCIVIEIVESFYADLRDPKNPLIDNPEDVARFRVEGEDLCLSKKVMGALSPYFHELFNAKNEGDKEFYELPYVDLDEFMHFVGILHCLDFNIHENSLDYLLKLGAKFQCAPVIRACKAYLRNAPIEKVSLVKKLFMADHFKLHQILMETIEKISKEEWKKFPEKHKLSSFAMDLIMHKFLLY